MAEPATTWHPDHACSAVGLLRAFNDAGVLNAADVHLATTLGRLAGERDETVLLAAALAVRGTRGGSVVLDLAGAAASIAPDEVDTVTTGSASTVGPLPWPEIGRWIEACAASPLVAGGDAPPPGSVTGAPASRPLRMVDGSVWLDRYFEEERFVAHQVMARLACGSPDFDVDRLHAGLDRLFPAPSDADQRAAAGLAVRSRFTVIVGGPGTGKTTTVARLLALLCDQPGPPPRIALAAPTGKAAARLTEAVQAAIGEFESADRERVGERNATTVHRLLGYRPGSRSRFRHDRTNHLPHDVVVVDETSMVSLTLMARLLEAVRPQARLVLVGDPDQLASVEAGAVLGDLIAGIEADGAASRSDAVDDLSDDSSDPHTVDQPGRPRLRRAMVRLRHNRRFDAHGEIALLAAAVRDGDVTTVLAALRNGGPAVEFVEVDDTGVLPDGPLARLRADVCAAGAAMVAAAVAGDGAAALDAAEGHRVLCAHRSGPRGARHWSDRVTAWLAAAGCAPSTAPRPDGRYLGEPLLVTTNDPELELFNGDTGVIVASERPGGLAAAFRRAGHVKLVAPARLPAVRTVHAMTVHRAQGSEFARVSILLPSPDSPLANRATLYTAITRASASVRLIGSAEAVARAVSHPAARATGLGARLRIGDGTAS